MQTISILGAGWLGLPLGNYLANQGYTVKGSTTSPDKQAVLRSQGLEPYIFSLEPQAIRGEFTDFFLSDVLILNIPPGRRDPHVHLHFPQKIQTLIDAIPKKKSISCLFISSTSVYGNTQGLVSAETKLAPATASGKALVEVEQMIQSYFKKSTILRMGGLVGNKRHPGKFLAGKKGLSGGNQAINLIHLEDCIGIIEAVLQQEVWGEVFNCVADTHPRKADYYTQAAEHMGLEVPQFLEGKGETGKRVSNQKVKELLSYSFIYGDPFDMLTNKNS